MKKLNEMTKEEKNKYYNILNRVIQHPEFKFDRKLGGADLEALTNMLSHGRSPQEAKSHIMKVFKISDELAGRIIRKIMNAFEELSKQIEKLENYNRKL